MIQIVVTYASYAVQLARTSTNIFASCYNLRLYLGTTRIKVFSFDKSINNSLDFCTHHSGFLYLNTQATYNSLLDRAIAAAPQALGHSQGCGPIAHLEETDSLSLKSTTASNREWWSLSFTTKVHRKRPLVCLN